MEDDTPKAKMLPVRLPVDFIEWFKGIAKRDGLTTQDAMREALLAWGKNHDQPKSTPPAENKKAKGPKR